MKNKNNETICLLYTTYHSFIWDLMSKQVHHKKITVVNFSNRKIKEHKNHKVIERTANNKITFLYKCITIAAKSKLKTFNLILPHPDHLLGNTLFFSKNVTKVTLMEDGVLNYYNYERTLNTAKIGIKRRRITYLTPFRYKIYSGHHSGVDDCSHAILSGWFTDPDNVIKKERFSSITKIYFPTNTTPLGRDNRTAILLDQPLEKFLTAATANTIRKKTIAFVEQNFQRVIIKPHPQHDSISMEVSNVIPFDFEQNTPIEETIIRIQPVAVVSYCSTALINISKISSSTQCISIGINEIIAELPAAIEIKELLMKNKVEIH